MDESSSNWALALSCTTASAYAAGPRGRPEVSSPMLHDLLTTPLLSWRNRNRRRASTTLPGVLARLASGELADFPRLRTHQLHPWCMFITQLASIALHRAGRTDP